jgi:hypothetical protein
MPLLVQAYRYLTVVVFGNLPRTRVADLIGLGPSVSDPDHYDTDPDPAFHSDTNPEHAFRLIRVRIRLFYTDPRFLTVLKG